VSNLLIFAAKDQDCIRYYEEEEHPLRSKFERDRDRIMYSTEFRRLSGKTQVFVTGSDDNVRTRLTHTLEVAQIAKTISKHLNLDVVLTEAIAFGHDIGHTPFGHIGERALNMFVNGCDEIKNINEFLKDEMKGFKHNWQGVRVATWLERIDRNYPGLNLTDYTLWGIVNHSKLAYGNCNFNNNMRCTFKHEYKKCDKSNFLLDFYNRYTKFYNEESWTMEALVVSIADEIAQRNHDIQDGLSANIVEKNELLRNINNIFSAVLTKDENAKLADMQQEHIRTYYQASISKFIVNLYVNRLIAETKANMNVIVNKYRLSHSNSFSKNKAAIRNGEDIAKVVSFDDIFDASEKLFHKYIKDRIINSSSAQRMDGKSSFIISKLIKAFISNPQQLPDSTILSIFRNYEDYNVDDNVDRKSFAEIVALKREETNRHYYDHTNNDFKIALLRTICDYIAGMTDNYALSQYEMLYGGTRFDHI